MLSGFDADDGTNEPNDSRDHFAVYWFGGSGENPRVAMREYQHVTLFASMTAVEIYASRLDDDVEYDVCEIAGGTARTSTILVRCRVRAGKNFDLCTGVDMTNPQEQKAFMQFRANRGVQVVIMSPICSPFGGWSHVNRYNATDSWNQSLEYALRLSSFCAVVALAQYEDGRDW